MANLETASQLLEPLPYHVELRDYLKSRERDLWNWFASARAQSDYTVNLRMDPTCMGVRLLTSAATGYARSSQAMKCAGNTSQAPFAAAMNARTFAASFLPGASSTPLETSSA